MTSMGAKAVAYPQPANVQLGQMPTVYATQPMQPAYAVPSCGAAYPTAYPTAAAAYPTATGYPTATAYPTVTAYTPPPSPPTEATAAPAAAAEERSKDE